MNRLKLVVLVVIVALIAFFPTLRAGFIGFKLINQSHQILESSLTYTQNFFSNKDKSPAEQLLSDLKTTEKTFLEFNQQANESWLIKKLLTNRKNQLDLAMELIQATQHFLIGEQTYVLLFQNSEELRATGGFLGSYAKLSLKDGVLIDFKIEDIYVPDGQFNWFIEAPTGAKEYLSGGDGLKLRDANWHPDFPTTAQQILTYLAWGKEAGIDGAIAINLPIVEEILDVTGPIYIHDYEQEVTKNNFSDVARADRNKFFPGSVQKQHFLNTFFNQLLIKLQTLQPEEQQLLAERIYESALRKNLQFFSHEAKLQSIFENQSISGEISKEDDVMYLMLVESNVGINKANQHLERAINLNIEDQQTILEVTFVNHNLPPNKNNPNEADHLGYVNYQRIVLSPEANIESINYDDQQILDWNEELISNSKGEIFKQVGFLITLPERETKKLTVKINDFSKNETEQIFIQKQSGIEKIPLYINKEGHEKSFDLLKDTLVNLSD